MKTGLKWVIAFWLLMAAALANAQSSSTVLVVANSNNAQSMALANYYMKARNIPAKNGLALKWDANDSADTCTLDYYKASIAAPIAAKIATLTHIDYIVLCRNLPSKISDTQGSVDSALAGSSTNKSYCRYFCISKPFNSTTYKMYLVTRLDGWSWADAFALVDNAQKAKGGSTILLDQDPTKAGGYTYYNSLMQDASKTLTKKRNVQTATADTDSTFLDSTNTFVDPKKPLGGYISWGSNDSHYSATAYNALTFTPGAIAETLVSTSAMFLRTKPGAGTQSQISQLIHAGVTGVKGYVAEPHVDATADPCMLFPAYLSGRNLAESFYSASYYTGWRDVVIGDPLCAPYHK